MYKTCHRYAKSATAPRFAVLSKFPHHKDFATFDYSAAAVTEAQIEPFCTGQFTQEAHNLILVGRTGTGKTHIAIALGTSLIKEQAEGNAGKIIWQLSALDCVIMDELGYIPFPKSGGVLLFHLISKLYDKDLCITIWASLDRCGLVLFSRYLPEDLDGFVFA